MTARIDLRLGLAGATAAFAVTAVFALLGHAVASRDAEVAARVDARVAHQNTRPTQRALGLSASLRQRDLDVLSTRIQQGFGAPAPWEPLSLDDRRRADFSLSTAVRASPADSALRSAQVVTRDGTVIASVDRVTAASACMSVVLQRPLALAGMTLTATFAQDCDLLAPPPRVERPAAAPVWASLLSGALVALATFAAVFLLARTLARRIALLVIATSRVGAGELDVRVRPRGDDDLDGLMRAFNLMVEELALSRSRIDYLQRIAGWQEFARRLAHEIKNPLTPIQLSVQEVARKYSGDDAKFKRTLETAREVVEEEIATLRRLVGAFSDFAKLPEVKTMPGDLAEFVRDAATSRAFLDEAAATDHKVTVRVDFQPGDVAIPVAIDRMMLRRAFENLVRNAVQAIEQRALKGGASTGTVWVKAVKHPPRKGAEDEGEQAWLVVEDDGPGIPPDHIARVFDPYFTTKSEGTGLGLAIVRKIALDHDGDVGLEAREGGGARFVITLPLREHGRTPRLSFVTFSGRGGTHPTPVEVDGNEKP